MQRSLLDGLQMRIDLVLPPPVAACRLHDPAVSSGLIRPSAGGWRNRRDGLANSPGHPPLLNQILEHLLVLQCIHRAKKALMSEGQELIVLDQPLEGFFDKLLTIAQIVEDLRAKDKEPAVDPEVGFLKSHVCR